MSIESELLKFNSNRENRDILAFYNRKSYMELAGVARREESHSAFLAWLLKGNEISSSLAESPMMWFLQILAYRENTLKDNSMKMPVDLKSAILSRNIEFTIDEVTPEKKVSDVNNAYFKKIGIKSQDELDIYIKCSIQNIPNIKEIEIIIENKITSPEEGPKPGATNVYGKMNQTQRYYKACSYNKACNKFQLFVYLHPDPLNENSKASCESDKYIQINYQDILDYILVPLVDKTDSDRIRFILNEYIECLSLPTIDVKQSKRIVMARSAKEEQQLAQFKEKNLDLLYKIMVVSAKVKYNKQLTSDEKILSAFASANDNLLHAVCEFGNINTDKPTYLIYPELKYYSTSGFGERFAEIFAKLNEDKVTCIKDLHDLLQSEIKLKGTMYYNPSAINKSTPNQLYEKYGKIDYKFDLLVTKSAWGQRETDLLTKLEKALNNNPKDYFKWEKIK